MDQDALAKAPWLQGDARVRLAHTHVQIDVAIKSICTKNLPQKHTYTYEIL